jgi:hypothetical protein
MDKAKCDMYIYNGIILTFKKEGNSDTCNNMDELQ